MHRENPRTPRKTYWMECRKLSHDTRVPEREPAGLGPDTEPVRAAADLDPLDQVPVVGGDGIDLPVVTAGQPEHLPVRRDVPHVRGAPAGQVTLLHDPAGIEGDQGDRPLAPRGEKQEGGGGPDVEAGRARPGGDAHVPRGGRPVEGPDR